MRRAVATCLAAGLGIQVSSGSARPPAESIAMLVSGRAELVELYRPGGFEPLWFGRGDRLSASAREAVVLLSGAERDGLVPGDYEASVLSELARKLDAGPAASDAVARFDTELSDQVLHYIRDLHMGRVDPLVLGYQLNVPRDGHNVSAWLLDALTHEHLADAVVDWAPRGPFYAALVAALARYRALAPGETDAPLLQVSSSIHPGDHYEGLDRLRARLELLGDLQPGVAIGPDDIYAGRIVEAVVRFQRRHGLEEDGVLGRRTMAQLAIPLAWRVRQLELALERLRWLPHEGEGRLLLVNIPMFRVYAWNSIPPAGEPSFSTGVIVGRAVATETPVFGATLGEIQFRPYWNVPRSIVRKEILPRLPRDPDYLIREHMELVAGQTDTSPVVEDSPENRARLRNGTVRLRQRPGPENALGLIKFSFPNENDVYMHATPAPALFAKSRRDFSHGCVRVQDPVGLATWVLKDQAGWDAAAITAAMNAPEASRVAVSTPVRVLLVYSTAAVDPGSGAVLFADDIYGHDARLDRALRNVER